MKPLNKNNDFVNFIFEGSFKFVGGLCAVQKLFNEYSGSCTVYGVREDGTRAVIDAKV